VDSLLDEEAASGTLEEVTMTSSTCERFDELLLDGEPLAMEMAARHAAACDACAEKLASWNEISDTARDMKTAWNSDLLWPRIERALKSERRRSTMRIWQVAAAIVMTVGLAVAMLFATRMRMEHNAYTKAILTDEAMQKVNDAERQHVEAIARLEQLTEPKLEETESQLMVSYKEKLVLLDDAIAECQTNIKRNRQNAHLRKQLLAIYTEKQSTLHEVLKEDSHVSNQ
jgi:hypothetical protein